MSGNAAETDVVRSPAVTLRIDWMWLIAALVLCVLFIPARVYAVPASLPFELDAYRLALFVVLLLWPFMLLSEPQVRLRRTGLEGPLALYGLALVGSLAANPIRFDVYQQEAFKTLAIFATLLLTLYFVTSVVSRLGAALTVLRMLVLGGAVLGLLAVAESRTGWTPFQHLDTYFPLLERIELQSSVLRGGHLRASASAEHPIALGALLAMLAPVSAALAVRARRVIWWVALAALVVGSVSTVSRTAIVMLIAGFGVLCILRWDDSRRFVPLALVVVAVTHLAVPGTLSAYRIGFSPSHLAVEQRTPEVSLAAGGRITDLGPSFEEFRAKPLLGYGIGTRIVLGEKANARILDNQWLASLLDTGLLSIIALVWLFVRYVGRLVRASTGADPSDGILLAALASSAFAYALGMFLFDAFAFAQVTLVLVLLLAVGCALALTKDRVFEVLPEPALAPRQARRETLRERLVSLRSRRRSRVAEQLNRVKDYHSGRFDDDSTS